MPDLEVHDVDQTRWPDFVRLFEAPGGPKYCWCGVWRNWRDAPGATVRQQKRATIEAQVRDGTPVGLLAYLDGEPAGWCSVAPRETFRPLGGVEDEPERLVWSLVCFYVPRRRRGTGIAGRLLDAAIERATEAGADVLEAYPVDPDSPSYLFMGFVPTFLGRGFEEHGMAGSRRHVMRLELSRGLESGAGRG
ncbi:MAG: GNAT family N-acetyltransferase [Dehalococcoidia bacterium]